VKLGKSSLFIAIAGVVLIGLLVLGYQVYQQEGTRQDLQTQLALVKQKYNAVNIDNVTVQKDKLTAQTSQTEVGLQDLKAQLSFSKNGIDVIDNLLADAEKYQVGISELGSSGLSSETVTGSRFETIPISFKASGTVENVTNFIYSLTTVFPTGVLKSTQLSIKSDPTSVNTTGTNPDLSTNDTEGTLSMAAGTAKSDQAEATLFLVIYNYAGE